jgi:hypothetical protein
MKKHKNKFLKQSDIPEYVQERLDFNKLLDALYVEALGGYKWKNANGITYTVRPDTKAIELLMRYGYGQPVRYEPYGNPDDVDSYKQKYQELMSSVIVKSMLPDSELRATLSTNADKTISDKK